MEIPKEVAELEAFVQELEKLQTKQQYLSKKEYQYLFDKYQEIRTFFDILKKSETLEDYANKNKLNEQQLNNQVQKILDFESQIQHHNEQFIKNALAEEKEYLDTILKDIDPTIHLDEEQRKIILSDEDYTLVIAGAGAGKTTTIAAKVKYLVEKKNISPEDILIISFTNKAVNELRQKINKGLHIDAIITTFHSIGNSILKQNQEEPFDVFNTDNTHFILNEYFKNAILTDPEMMKKLILFFSEYFDIKTNQFEYETLRDNPEKLQEIVDKKTKKKVTINNEVVRSQEEAIIANFLYLNGIKYEYEPKYPYYIENASKPYTPDFLLHQGDNDVYLEHFGLTEKLTHNKYSKETLEKYKQAIQTKKEIHQTHHTQLIYTFSEYNDGLSITHHLEEQLRKNGFHLTPMNPKQVLLKLTDDANNLYIKKIVHLLTVFIRNFKVNGYNIEDFSTLSAKTSNVRTKLFLEIAKQAYLYYQNYLERNHKLDFEDMINQSVEKLKTINNLGYKYIIIDEYQDISQQRFNLAEKLSKVCDAKIIAVGDDWQAIYAFSGADITLFTEFEEIMGYCEQLKIQKTYRNSQEIIDIAGNFIQHNKKQITKSLISPKHIKDPIIVYPYHTKYSSKEETNDRDFAQAVNDAIEDIEKQNLENNTDNKDILLLGRFGFDAYKLGNTESFYYNKETNRVKSLLHPEFNITFMTAHSAKGLGYSNVIIINGKNETYGFPAKIDDDPILKMVIKTDHSYNYAEERRLFYVALTRTKNRVYIVCPDANPSEFLLEILKENENIHVKGEINTSIKQISSHKCPICGFPLQYKYKKSIGLKLYICTNEEEACGFITNNLKGGRICIEKCNKCTDGYLIVKENRAEKEIFLGCTNYHENGGCTNTMSKQDYFKKHPSLEVEKLIAELGLK